MPVLAGDDRFDPDHIDWGDDDEPIDQEHGDLFDQLYGPQQIERSILDFYSDEEAGPDASLPYD